MQLKGVAKRLMCLTSNPSPWNLSESFRLPSNIPYISPHSHSFFGSNFKEKTETIRKCSQAPTTTFNYLSACTPCILLFLLYQWFSNGRHCYWPMARDAAKYPTMHRTAPHTKNYLGKMPLVSGWETLLLQKHSILELLRMSLNNSPLFSLENISFSFLDLPISTQRCYHFSHLTNT